MSVKVQRDTGWVGMGTKFSLNIKGEKKDKIAYLETTELMIDHSVANIQASQFGVKTNELTVTQGDEVRLITTNFGKYSIWVLILAMPITSFFADRYRFITTLLIISIYGFTAFIMNGLHYRLEKF